MGLDNGGQDVVSYAIGSVVIIFVLVVGLAILSSLDKVGAPVNWEEVNLVYGLIIALGSLSILKFLT